MYTKSMGGTLPTSLHSVAEVAEYLHLHEDTVRRYIAEGKLKAKKVGGRILISDEAVESLLEPYHPLERLAAAGIPLFASKHKGATVAGMAVAA